MSPVFLAGVGVGIALSVVYVLTLSLAMAAGRADRTAALEHRARLEWERAMDALMNATTT